MSIHTAENIIQDIEKEAKYGMSFQTVLYDHDRELGLRFARLFFFGYDYVAARSMNLETFVHNLKL